MELIAEFIMSFFKGLNTVKIELFGKYSFSLWEMFFISCVLGIIGYFVWGNIGDK